eukprot:m.146865 g.146865  ORF g.146865 m.146865 type:complete len:293 (-) comp14155_c0_seq1:365-1243(-)
MASQASTLPLVTATPGFMARGQVARDPDTTFQHAEIEVRNSVENVRFAFTRDWPTIIQLQTPLAVISVVGTPETPGYTVRSTVQRLSGGRNRDVHQYTDTIIHRFVEIGPNWVRIEQSRERSLNAPLFAGERPVTTFIYSWWSEKDVTVVHVVSDIPAPSRGMLCLCNFCFCGQFGSMQSAAEQQALQKYQEWLTHANASAPAAATAATPAVVGAQSTPVTTFQSPDAGVSVISTQPSAPPPPAHENASACSASAPTVDAVSAQDSQPVFCGKCGTKAVGGNSFCQTCGSKL